MTTANKSTTFEVLNLGYPELSFEISESEYPLEVIIEHVERQYPGYRFSRTEGRYTSCVMAIFERD